MSENEILERLQRNRNDCSELLKLCRRLKTDLEEGAGDSPPSRDGLEAVAALLAGIVPALRAMPARPCESIGVGPRRTTAAALLRETGELLECALVIERELREYGNRPPAAAARAYARSALEAQA